MDYDQIQRDLAKLDNIVAVKRAGRDPHANRLTPIFKRGSEGYDCFAQFKNARGQLVAFYVSRYVNVAGYVLTWRTTYAKNGKKVVTDLTAFKSRGAAVGCAERRAAKMRAALGRTKDQDYGFTLTEQSHVVIGKDSE